MEPDSVPEHSLMIEENMPHSLPINVERARFPCCIVWTPLPVLSWFVPFIGHIGICREDGVILDFAGPNFVCVDNFAFGAPTRYCQIKKQQVYIITETFKRHFCIFLPLCYNDWHQAPSVILTMQDNWIGFL